MSAVLKEDVDVNEPFVERADGLLSVLLGSPAEQRIPPLCAAVRRGNVAIVRLLLNAGADVDARPEPKGDVPLGTVLATRRWDAEMLLAILAARPDPMRVTWRHPSKVSAQGKGAYHLVPKIYKEWIQREWFETDAALRGSNALIEAARVGDVVALRAALAGGIAPDAADEDGWTTLLWACSAESASAEASRALLDAGADQNRASRWGWTPLMAAAHANEVPIVRALLERGADPNAIESTEPLR